jgi:hypothetical protein
MHHFSKSVTPPAEPKLLVSGIHFDFIAAIITGRPNGIVSL